MKRFLCFFLFVLLLVGCKTNSYAESIQEPWEIETENIHKITTNMLKATKKFDCKKANSYIYNSEKYGFNESVFKYAKNYRKYCKKYNKKLDFFISEIVIKPDCSAAYALIDLTYADSSKLNKQYKKYKLKNSNNYKKYILNMDKNFLKAYKNNKQPKMKTRTIKVDYKKVDNEWKIVSKDYYKIIHCGVILK